MDTADKRRCFTVLPVVFKRQARPPYAAHGTGSIGGLGEVGFSALGELGHAGSCRQGAHLFKGRVGVASSTRSIKAGDPTSESMP